jgi:hypothetical protein
VTRLDPEEVERRRYLAYLAAQAATASGRALSHPEIVMRPGSTTVIIHRPYRHTGTH